MMDITTIKRDNSLADAKELLRSLPARMTDKDFAEQTLAGFPLAAAADRYIETYEGSVSFVRELKMNRSAGRRLSDKQYRAALNVLRDELLGTTRKAAPTREERVYDCFKCGEPITGITALRAHKSSCRGSKADADDHGGADPTPEEPETPVIAVTTSSLNIDLSGLPDGRYAAPDVNNDRGNDFLFFSVRRSTKEKTRTKRYKWSKYRYGRETVPEGTIEVKEWSSDTKRLFGEQKPEDEFYRGEFEEHLKLVMEAPEAWGRLFGQMLGHCFRCGKKLTDEESRSRGFGPECAKHLNSYRL